MRLDKFLKLTRLIKRRTVANALCDLGGVSINGKVAKASTAVAVGQKIDIRLGNRWLVATVQQLPTRALGNQTQALEYITIIKDQAVYHEHLPVDGNEDGSE
jgi:ribosomal 50S subunit-recycling heat shock protein